MVNAKSTSVGTQQKISENLDYSMFKHNSILKSCLLRNILFSVLFYPCTVKI